MNITIYYPSHNRSLQALVGNGFKWKYACEVTVHARDHCFMYNGDYISFINGHISFVKDFSVGALILFLTDLAITDGNSEYLYRLLPTYRPPFFRPISPTSSMDFERDAASPPCSIPPDSDSESDCS